ncbi:MAG: HDIG domain-containing protein [Desulfovibrio sp.]|jgi:putative nucleotidyltransferase with HDIG domain|nr:HDIG domain-containing protein [Desulfovibrio sp.]
MNTTTEALPARFSLRRPLADLPWCDVIAQKCPLPPLDDQSCFALWNEYDMLPNVRLHSLLVASIAGRLAERALERGFDVSVEQVRAAALLHDIAKSYCVRHGGSHALAGASWVVERMLHYPVAQGVLFHVHWPWPLPANICALPFFIIYADKRVCHDSCVTLEDRFEDLITRYGKSEDARQGILASFEQGKSIERAFTALLEWDIHEDTFNFGRLVRRTNGLS